MSDAKRQLLVTSALPYANGSIHLGHLVEYIQTDIWVRFQQMRGHDCHYICADDAHGTAIMLSAKKQGISPEALIDTVNAEHLQDFTDFNIAFDTYYSTHSPENKTLSEFIYQKAVEANSIDTRDIDQFFDEKEGIFLADRFIKGTCPFCNAADQYGDNCEKCFAIYTPDQLISPYSALSGTPPIKKTSTHYFFKLRQFESDIKTWLATNPVSKEVQNKLKEWFDTGLKDWDISRDAPYFGFQIPGTTDKYFYVWLDAPVGYMAATQHWCEKEGRSFEEIWKTGNYEIHHFIGKDILYFHSLFWPAMLHVSGFKQPTKVNVHGFLTVNGEKMSKSRGTFILARTYLDHLNPEFLRYYYASKLSGTMDDIDFNLDDFLFKVNSDVLGKVINIGSRLASIVHKKLHGRLTVVDDEGRSLLDDIRSSQDVIAAAYDSLDYNGAMREIMRLADVSNRYIDTHAPWALAKTDPDKAEIVCTTGLNALRLLMIYLTPVLPQISQGVRAFLACDDFSWADLSHTLTNQPLQPYTHLASRLTPEEVSVLI